MLFYLPKRRNGFTLIELMVVMAIIAILAIIGLVVYSGLQKSARDSKRKSDILAIGKAMEAHYNASVGNYPALQTTWFSQGTIPSDPNSSNVYCAWYNYTSPLNAVNTSWFTSCPSSIKDATGVAVPSSQYGAVSATSPTNPSTPWTICAWLESSSASYCITNQQ